MTKKPSTQRSPKIDPNRLDSLHAVLRQWRGEILSFLRKHPEADIRSIKVPLFAMVCDAIHASAKVWHQGTWTDDTNFYLWPGYNSLTPDDTGSYRVDLRISLQAMAGEGEAPVIECGISPPFCCASYANDLEESQPGAKAKFIEELNRLIKIRRKAFRSDFPDEMQSRMEVSRHGPNWILPGLIWPCDLSGNPSLRLMGNPCSVGFYAFLSASTHFENAPHSVGSTHGWLIDSVPRYPSAPNDPDLPVRGLVFHCSADKTKSASLKNALGFAIVPLESGQEINWGQNAAKRLNDSLFPTRPDREWPAQIRNQQDAEWNQERARDLYSAWLQAVFLQSATSSSFDVVLPKELALQEAYRTRKDWAKRWTKKFSIDFPYIADFIFQHSNYTHWYSLALDRAVPHKEDGGQDSLGSIMFFTNQPLHFSYLLVLRLWVENLFMLVREVESRQISREVGESMGMDQLLDDMSHELCTEVTTIGRRVKKAAESIIFKDWISTTAATRGDPPFGIVFPHELVAGQLQYLRAWIDKAGPIPKTLDDYPTLNDFFRAIFEEYKKYIPLQLHSDDAVRTVEGYQHLLQDIDSCSLWLNRISTYQCSSKRRIKQNINHSKVNFAAGAAARIFLALLTNATKHTWNERQKTSNPFINIEVTDGESRTNQEWIEISVENYHPSKIEGFSQSTKRKGTESTVRSLGTRFQIDNKHFCFGLIRDNCWRSSIRISTFYQESTKEQKQWTSNG